MTKLLLRRHNKNMANIPTEFNQKICIVKSSRNDGAYSCASLFFEELVTKLNVKPNPFSSCPEVKESLDFLIANPTPYGRDMDSYDLWESHYLTFLDNYCVEDNNGNHWAIVDEDHLYLESYVNAPSIFQ